MKYLRDKYVGEGEGGRDDQVEEWALEWERENSEYQAKDYGYS